MKLTEGRISILVGQDSTTIEFIDITSGVTFAKAKLTPEQLSSALSRLAMTECQIDVFGLDKLNKKMELKDHVFEVPYSVINRRDNMDEIRIIAEDTCPEGWVPDSYFGSKNSFFERDGKNYARTTIRRWI